MQSVAICITRDEADIIAFSVLHHILAGVDHCVVIDNGSSDGTSDLLKAIARKTSRVSFIRDPSPFHQQRIVSAAASEFTRRNETIVIVFDSDEFWNLSVDALVRHFERADVNVFRCEVQNFIQSRTVDRPTPWSGYAPIDALRWLPETHGNWFPNTSTHS